MVRRCRVQLLHDLLRLLRRPEISVVQRPIIGADCRAYVVRTYEQRNPQGKLLSARIVLDPDQGGNVSQLLHELLHLLCWDELKVWGNLEETVAKAIIADLDEYLEKQANRPRFERVRRLKARKLEAS